MASCPATKTIPRLPGWEEFLARMGFLWPECWWKSQLSPGPHSSEQQNWVENGECCPGPLTCNSVTVLLTIMCVNSVTLWSPLYWPLSTDPLMSIIPPWSQSSTMTCLPWHNHMPGSMTRSHTLQPASILVNYPGQCLPGTDIMWRVGGRLEMEFLENQSPRKTQSDLTRS